MLQGASPKHLYNPSSQSPDRPTNRLTSCAPQGVSLNQLSYGNTKAYVQTGMKVGRAHMDCAHPTLTHGPPLKHHSYTHNTRTHSHERKRAHVHACTRTRANITLCLSANPPAPGAPPHTHTQATFGSRLNHAHLCTHARRRFPSLAVPSTHTLCLVAVQPPPHPVPCCGAGARGAPCFNNNILPLPAPPPKNSTHTTRARGRQLAVA